MQENPLEIPPPTLIEVGIDKNLANDCRKIARHNLPFDTIEIALDSREHALLWIEENQLGRRNPSLDQRAAIVFRVMRRRSELAVRERNQAIAAKGAQARWHAHSDTVSDTASDPPAPPPAVVAAAPTPAAPTQQPETAPPPTPAAPKPALPSWFNGDEPPAAAAPPDPATKVPREMLRETPVLTPAQQATQTAQAAAVIAEVRERTKRDTRAEVAREMKVPERKLRAIVEIEKHDPGAVDRIGRGEPRSSTL